MEAIFMMIGGCIGGLAVAAFKDIRSKSFGIIHVDHKNETCVVQLTSDDLLDRKIKKVELDVNHDANLSREEQSL